MKGYNHWAKSHAYSLRPLGIILFAAFHWSFLCSVQAVHSAQVTLEWEASPGDAAGYNVYQGTYARDYDVKLDVGNWTSVTIADLEDGQAYYFAVTAYNADGNESGYSNEVCVNCSTTSSAASGSGGGGGCFIDTTAYEFRKAK